MLKISHRGLYESELPRFDIGNKLEDFQKVLELGTDMIEIDVRLKNEELFLSHDENISDYATPLIEALDFLKGKCEINIEIKNPGFIYYGIDEKVLKVIKKLNIEDDIIISSFNHHTIHNIRRISKNIRTGILYSAMWLMLKEEVDYIKPHSIHPEFDIVFCLDTVSLHRKGYKVFPWVAKTKESIQKAKDFKHIDGLIVDDLSLFEGIF